MHRRRSGHVTFRAAALLALAALAIPSRAPGQVLGAALSFEAAQSRFLEVSDQLAVSAATVRGRQRDADSLAWLHGPQVDLDMKQLRLQKTVDLPLAPLNGFLSLLPGAPAVPLPDQLTIRDRGSHYRPEVAATMPVYTGGKINAIQDTASAAVAQASADDRVLRQSLTVSLVQAYFGQALAERGARIRNEVLEGLEQHLRNAEQMEKQGIASRAQRLQAQVARDEAARAAERASREMDNARVVLAGLLHERPGIPLATPLFVISGPIAALGRTIAEGTGGHPQLARLDAVRDQAIGAVRVEQSKFLPTVYLFGKYDLYRRDALLTEPDWVFGIGLSFPLFSNVDRSSSIAAARERQIAVESGIRQARLDLDTNARVAINRLETARRQFDLLDSGTQLALENLRLQDLSFKEGQATSLDVVDARLSLGRAKLERAAAAYEFDVALAQLLSALGVASTFSDYIRLADKVIDDD